MQDYINSIKNNQDNRKNIYTNTSPVNNKSTATPNIFSNFEPDSFENEDNRINTSDNKKIDKKKIFKIGAIIAGIGLAVLAFLKRKQIGSALSNLFNKKKPPKPPTPPTDNIPNPKTPPAAPPTVPPTKPIQASEPAIQGGLKIQPDTDKIKPTGDIRKNASKSAHNRSKDLSNPHGLPPDKPKPPTNPSANFNKKGGSDAPKPSSSAISVAISKHDSIYANRTLQEYTELCEEFEELRKLDVSNPTRKAAAQKLNALEKQMIKQNISFVPKAPESFASDKIRWQFIKSALWETQRNEASTMDALDVFEKYGEKIYQAEPLIDTLGDLGASVSAFLDRNKGNQESLNRVLRKYVDVYSKFATTEIRKGYSPDSRHLRVMFDSYCYWVDKKTTIKFIDALKNLAVDKNDCKKMGYFFKSLIPGDTPSAACWLTKQDLPDIQKALEEFTKAVENLPDDIMKV